MTDQPPVPAPEAAPPETLPRQVPPPRPPMTAEEREAARKAQRNRNIAIALGLVAFIVIVYLVTVLKMGGNVADRPL